MNVLDVADRNRILDLLRKGWSIRHVARDTGHRHETIRRYGIEAGILVPKPAKCTTSAEVATESKPHTEPEVPAASVQKPHTAPEVPTGSTRSTHRRADHLRPRCRRIASQVAYAPRVRSILSQSTADEARARAVSVIEKYGKSCPKAMEILAGGLEGVLSFYAFPGVHPRKVWSSNPIEHLNGTPRKRANFAGKVEPLVAILTWVVF